MKYKLPKEVKVDGKLYGKLVELYPDRATVEFEDGTRANISRDRVYTPAQHMGVIHIPAEEDYDRRIEVIWAETYKEAREFFDNHLYAHRPNSPHDCTGQWFTIRATWKEVNVPNIYFVDHHMGCDV